MLWLRRTSTLLKGSLSHCEYQLRHFGGLKNFNISSSIGALKKRSSENKGKSHLDVPENPLESVELKNGMRLVCDCRESCITTVGCFLPAGAMHETPQERGASLLMEHLIFRRTCSRSQEDIARILDEIGGKLGALAMRDMFLFWGSASSCDVETIVELLADVVLNGFANEEDIDYERLIILRELSEMETDHERVVMDYLPTTAYQGTELGRSVYPNTCALQNLKAENVESFRKRLFKPSFMTMISTGGTSFKDIESVASEYFLKDSPDCCSQQDECAKKDFPCMPCMRFTGSEIRLRDDDEDLGYVAVAVEGPGHSNCQDHCTLTVAKEIVGSWDVTHGGGAHNAPYLAHCAFGTDMCHMYKSFNFGWSQTGLWGCYFVCEKMELEDMMWMVQNEWMRLCSTITSKELDRAVNQCRTRELVRVNDSVDRFFDIATCLYRRGCYETFDSRLSRFERVTPESLKDVAMRYIYDQCLAVAAVGRVENLPDYNRIRAYMYRIRH